MRRQIFTAFALMTALTVFTAPSAAGDKAVVELFTSQGCSSCPPADELLGELAQRDDVVALSYSVDYWDYLGWTDSFAKPEHSRRQRAYARTRGDRKVYTPQIVVDGQAHVVGSDRNALQSALANGGEKPVSVDLTVDARMIEVRVSRDRQKGRLSGRGAAVWLVGYTAAAPVAIGRGENAGREVTYHNVVRKIVRVGTWRGGDKVFRIKRSDLWSDAVSGCAVIVQLDTIEGAGPILGSAIVAESS